MHNDKVVIQRIGEDSKIVVFQNNNASTPWSFDSYGNCGPNVPHPDVFPFVFDKSEKFVARKAGAETQISLRKDRDIWFADDYSVPAGMLIGVLFPKNYVPEVFKFKDKPFIPIGGVQGVTEPPGHIEVQFNQPSRQSAIIFHITKTSYFGFKCVAKYRDDSFPPSNAYPFIDELIETVGSGLGQIEVTLADIQEFRPIFKKSADLSVVVERMNEVINVCKLNMTGSDLANAKANLWSSLSEAIGTTASLTAILDSYQNSGSVHGVVAKLLALFML